MIGEAQKAELSDEEVVERVLAGDTALFEVLMRRHNQRIYRAVRSILGRDDDAEDVMQEAYVKAYQHLDQFERRARFSTWLTRIAIHEAFHRLRRADAKTSAQSDGEAMTRIPSHDRDPERRTFDRELSNLLEQAIDNLPEHYRTVFVLREVEDVNTADTAECLGLSEENVKIRLHRARALLRDQLYDQVGGAARHALPFPATRCDRVVNAVLVRIRDSLQSTIN